MAEPVVSLTPILHSREEAAALLGICVRSLDYLIAELPNGEQPRIRTRRMGRRVLVPHTEVTRISRMDIIAIRPRKVA